MNISAGFHQNGTYPFQENHNRRNERTNQQTRGRVRVEPTLRLGKTLCAADADEVRRTDRPTVKTQLHTPAMLGLGHYWRR